MLDDALWFLEEGVFSSSAGEGQTCGLSCVHQVNLMLVSWFGLVWIGMWQMGFYVPTWCNVWGGRVGRCACLAEGEGIDRM